MYIGIITESLGNVPQKSIGTGVVIKYYVTRFPVESPTQN